MTEENNSTTLPTTEIPLNGQTSAAATEAAKLLSGDSEIDKFLDLPDETPAKAIHEEFAGEDGNDKGEENGEELQKEEGDKEVSPEPTEVEDKVQTEGEDGASKTATNEPTLKTPASPKVLSAKLGDKTLEVDEATTFTFKVDGKEVQAQVSELIQNYKGKIPWDRHYRQLKQDRAKFDADIKDIDNKIKEIVELSQVDPFKALERTMIMAGKNPADFLSIYLKQAQKTAEDIEGKSEDEIKAWVSAKRTEYEAEKTRLERSKVDAEKQELAVSKFISEKQTEHSISEEELESAWQFANLPENAQYLAGKTPQQIAELVVNYIINVDRPYTLIENTVGEIAPELRKDGNFVRELREHFKNYPNLTRDDIKIVVEGYLGKESSEKSHAKPSKEPEAERPRTSKPNPSQTSPKKTAKSNKALEEFDPISSGDLDELTQLMSK